MTNTANLTNLVDEKSGMVSRQAYQLDRTYRVGAEPADVVRVQVHRDSYAQQCWATVSVLSAQREWTILATERGSEIDAVAPSPHVAFERDSIMYAALGSLADALIVRGLTILGY